MKFQRKLIILFIILVISSTATAVFIQVFTHFNHKELVVNLLTGVLSGSIVAMVIAAITYNKEKRAIVLGFCAMTVRVLTIYMTNISLFINHIDKTRLYERLLVITSLNSEILEISNSMIVHDYENEWSEYKEEIREYRKLLNKVSDQCGIWHDVIQARISPERTHTPSVEEEKLKSQNFTKCLECYVDKFDEYAARTMRYKAKEENRHDNHD